jgi:Zn-dependent peptidase ImmA (M78 family)
MTDQELDEATVTAITETYERADVAHPTPERPIVPLGELAGCFNLTWQELPQLTGAAAITFLRERAGAFEMPRNLADEHLAGFLYATPRYGNIFVEQDDRLTRRRFSVAHELGHYLLHVRPYFAQHSSDDAGAPLGVVEALPTDGEQEDGAQLQGHLMLPAGNAGSANRVDADEGAAQWRVEEEANRFAAELLMPAEIVAALALTYGSQMGPGDLVWRLASEMLVSRATVQRRLHDLGLVPPKRRTTLGLGEEALN